MKKNDDTTSFWEAWQTYKQQVLRTPGLTDSELEQIYTESLHQPSLPTPPIPAAPRPSRLPFAAIIIVLLITGAILLLLNLDNPAADTPLQAQLAAPANADITLPAAAPGSTPPATPPPATPRRPAVAKAVTNNDSGSQPAPADSPLPEPADTLCPPRNTISLDNMQFTALYCNNETCDTQRYLFQVFDDLNLV